MYRETDTIEKLERRILHLKSCFSNYNIVRMREALRYLTGPKLELFIKIPFLIHVNLPAFPGFVDSDTATAAHGIHNFEHSGFYNEVLKQNLLPKNPISQYTVASPCVEGFYHIGSLGTFTQSVGSDFDYWVIIDKKKFSDIQYYNLEKKLDQLLKFSRETYDQEVTFYVMDKENIKNNCYAQFNAQETLTAPKIFLKEEFYRTFLMIAGKIPFWTILPSKGDAKTYAALVKNISSISRLNPISKEFIDLGTIEEPGTQDIITGILWHICKSRFDPVKALIKASMIFSSGFYPSDQKGLLCDEIKTKYANAGIDDYHADPYKLLFDRILKFYQENDPKGLSLIKSTIFFRLCGYPRVSIPEMGSPKRQLLDWYIRNWNLGQTQVNKLLSYITWAEPEKLLLEKTIITRLNDMYQMLLQKYPSTQTEEKLPAPEKRNFKILLNKTKERLNPDPGKIAECSTYLKQQKFQLFVLREKQFTGWHLSCYLNRQPHPEKLHASSSLLGLLGWILENQLYARPQSAMKIDLSLHLFESHALPADPDKLYLALQPVKPLSDDIFENSPTWLKLMILLVYPEKKGENILERAEFLALNTWGELYSDTLALDTDKNIGDKYKDIAVKIDAYGGTGLRLFFFQLAKKHDPDAVFEIKQHLAKGSVKQYRRPGDPDKNRPLLDRL
ncbi:MAG: class I adenylate cyclase [Proteobacteria bacterium]|nr:adenylate cyclase [Desulfobacula sp.]MBU4133026.1 class I adenylate cyclase [Pseudomonadota bacterium]